MSTPQLPLYYYHDHFREMIATVVKHYDHIIDAGHRAFIQRFDALSRDAQCLFVRMVNRRGQVFHRKTLSYAEIDTSAAIEELFLEGFVRFVDAGDYPSLLSGLDKAALLGLARQSDVSAVRSSRPKAHLIDLLSSSTSFEQVQSSLDLEGYLVRGHGETLDFLLYLYFGKAHRDLKSFALRDLGIVAVNGREATGARFADAAEAQACFLYSRLSASLGTSVAFETARVTLLDGLSPPTAYATLLHDRLALQVGLHLEKGGQVDDAIAVYRTADDLDCNTRRVRLLHAAGHLDQCRVFLERLIDDPGSDAEYDFATEFYARKFERRRLGACTALLRESQSIEVDEAYRTLPEEGAAGWFAREGWIPYWTESSVWLALFGLIFWEELFGAQAELHSGFDRLPRCLADRSFHKTYADTVAARLDLVRGGSAAGLIDSTIDQHRGAVNGLVSWQSIDDGAVQSLASHSPPAALAAMLEMMCGDFHSFTDGFPDLMLTRSDSISADAFQSDLTEQKTIRFVEVKAEGDVVRRNQLTRLRQLQRAGFAATICRVTYRYDPEQTYVVVDVETTGSRAGIGRVIEIGAVKLRNHETVDEWHSLIDPERHIPSFITGLTGIDGGMVTDAPKFREIAADLAAFMTNSVFAAHSVNFDYGFIASEFRRVNMPFRLPKFCTCAGMRRHQPGQSSYSLGALCEAFNIPLERHHRALDDAHAAAQLLCLINRRREDYDLAQ